MQNKNDIYEEIAINFYKEFNLLPNYDIEDLLENKLGIELIMVDNLPKSWFYAFNDDVNNLKIFYKKENALTITNKRFILAIALADIISFYRLDDNNLEKVIYNNKVYCRGNKGNLKTDTKRDFELKYFAMCFLAPSIVLEEEFKKLLRIYQNNLTEKNLTHLGNKFGISYNNIYQRCKVLNLIR